MEVRIRIEIRIKMNIGIKMRTEFRIRLIKSEKDCFEFQNSSKSKCTSGIPFKNNNSVLRLGLTA